MLTQPMLQCWQHSLQRGYYHLNVDCVEESYCCCYKYCCKRSLQKLPWAFAENVPRQILQHTLLELVLPADDVVNAAAVAVEEAAVAAEHSNLAEEAVLHNKIVVEAVAAVVVAADSPFQNCYLDPSSLTHRVAAEEVPFPVEVDDNVHWYWLVPLPLKL